jgi:Nif-specific ferredoxin III
MNVITGVTRGGAEWTPAFITALNQGKCIGCGRCFKVCPREVFELVEREAAADDDELDDDYDDDGDDGFSDDTSMVMSLMNALDCIGCQACSRVCPKKCLSHASAEAAA